MKKGLYALATLFFALLTIAELWGSFYISFNYCAMWMFVPFAITSMAVMIFTAGVTTGFYHEWENS